MFDTPPVLKNRRECQESIGVLRIRVKKMSRMLHCSTNSLTNAAEMGRGVSRIRVKNVFGIAQTAFSSVKNVSNTFLASGSMEQQGEGQQASPLASRSDTSKGPVFYDLLRGFQRVKR